MKSLLVVFCLCALTDAAYAETDPFVGRFTHDYTCSKDESVWTVKKSGTAWQALVHGSHETVSARRTSDAEQKAFWEQV